MQIGKYSWANRFAEMPTEMPTMLGPHLPLPKSPGTSDDLSKTSFAYCKKPSLFLAIVDYGYIILAKLRFHAEHYLSRMSRLAFEVINCRS
jgi:hypothetical protein